MSLTLQQLRHIAKLCALKLNEQDEQKFLGQLDNIIGFVDQLQEVDVEGIEPLSHPLEGKYLEPQQWVRDFENKKELFNNVKHPIKNNWIVIKSPIKS